MNCTKVQRRLAGQMNPARVPSSLKEHLAACATCRDYQHRLVQVERSVPLLHTPSAPLAKERLLQEIRTQPTWWAPVKEKEDDSGAVVRPLPQRWQRWQVAAAAAAAILLMVAAFQFLPRSGDSNDDVARRQPDPDPVLARLHQNALALAEADKPRQQVELLADVADDLKGMAFKVCRESGSRELSEWYAKVLDAEVDRAAAVPAAERRAVLEPIAERLTRTALDADKAAAEIKGQPGSATLTALAASARNARNKLEALNWPAGARLPDNKSAGAPVAWSRLSLLPAVASASAVLRADDAPASASDDLRRFRRNHSLIRALVDGSVMLSRESDQLRRAQLCTSVARNYANEIQSAASHREGARAVELGQQLHDLLQRGVAANLSTVIKSTPVGSARDAEFVKLNHELEDVVGPLEEQLQSAGNGDRAEYQRALQAVRDGRSLVAKALDGRGQAGAEMRRIN